MKRKFFITTICALTISIFQTQAMENSLNEKVFLNRSFSKSELDTQASIFYNKLESHNQLSLKNDLLCKTFAYCSHRTRCNAQLACKQFYYTASINNLDKLVTHDFIIGDEKEKAAFFKAIIKTNNSKLITPLLQYAKKNAPLYIFKNAIYEIGPKHYTEKKYTQDFYLNPLLKEALEQENSIMIDRLKQEDINTDIIKDYYGQKADQIDRCVKGTGGCFGMMATIGLIISCPIGVTCCLLPQ